MVETTTTVPTVANRPRSWFSTSGAASRKVWVLPVLCSLVPFVVVTTLIGRHYVEVPVWDQWELVPLLAKAHSGSLSFNDVWSQHNEHRLLVPRLLMLLLARTSGWSVGAELVTNVTLAIGLFSILAYQLRDTLRTLNAPTYTVWLLPMLALQTFSLQQYDNWLWGWQIQIFLNVFAVVLGLTLLARPRFRWWHLAAACFCGAVAVYSFVSGVSYWTIGALLLWTAPPGPDRRFWPVRWLWVAAGLLVVGSYLVGYQTVTGHPALSVILQQPSAYLEYVMTYLGAPIVSFDQNAAKWVGLVSSGMFGGLMWSARRLAPAQQRTLWPFTGLGLYALCSAALTGMGRAGFGSAQAMESRYVTLAYFLGLVVIVFLVLSRPILQSQSPVVFVLANSAAAGLVLLIAWSSLWARPRFAERHVYLAPARAALLALSNDDLLARLYPDPAVIRQRALFLQAQNLSVFRYAEP